MVDVQSVQWIDVTHVDVFIGLCTFFNTQLYICNIATHIPPSYYVVLVDNDIPARYLQCVFFISFQFHYCTTKFTCCKMFMNCVIN